jgi:lipoprotein NlpD
MNRFLNYRAIANLGVYSSVCVMLLQGCTSTPLSLAPVEDRPATQTVIVPPAMSPPTAVRPVAPSAAPTTGGAYSSNAPTVIPINPTIAANAAFAGKPGYYTVKPGDTLFQVGRLSGQNARDITRWNNIDNPNQIEPGQVLRVAPPEGGLSAGTVSAAPIPPVRPPSVVASPIPPAGVAAAGASSAAIDDDIAWIWPSNGALISGYDEVKSKGLKFAGKLGDPVFASADGRVVYAGSGLRGYGNLVILKHNETYLTAYAHNQTLLVKEDQTVRKGQRIADMGNSDADRVMLHFEVRRAGKPVDPAKYLPAR